MTVPIQEPNTQRRLTRGEWRTNQLERRPAPPPTFALYHIKVFSDTQTVVAGDEAFIFAIPADVDGYQLISVQIDVTTVSSSGIVQVQIRNITQAVDMLSTRAEIDVSEFNSMTAATQPVINVANAIVQEADRISVDVDAAGVGAMGLGVVLGFDIA